MFNNYLKSYDKQMYGVGCIKEANHQDIHVFTLSYRRYSTDFMIVNEYSTRKKSFGDELGHKLRIKIYISLFTKQFQNTYRNNIKVSYALSKWDKFNHIYIDLELKN